MKMEQLLEKADMTRVQENEEILELTDKIKEIIARNPFARYIGIELLEAAKGYARARIRLRTQYENIYGGMHGGCAFSLADTLAGVAAASCGDLVTTLDASVNYMCPVKETLYLYCEARVQRSGRKISVVRTELTDDGGKLLIDGSFTYYHLPSGSDFDGK